MSITACMRLELAGVDPFYKATVAKADFTMKELLISEQGTISAYIYCWFRVLLG
jgi:hypothetical protein